MSEQGGARTSPLVLAAAWRLATEIVGHFADGHVAAGHEAMLLVARAGDVDVATFDLGAEPELRSTSLPPIPASEWAWPMPHRELRRMGHRIALAVTPSGDDVKHPRGRVEAQVITRVLSRLVLSGKALEVSDVRREPSKAPSWLAHRRDLTPVPGLDEVRPMWAVRIDDEIVGAVHDAWLFTPAGESVNLYARYLAGASIEELSTLVIGRRSLPEEVPPGVVQLPDKPFDRDDDRWVRVLYSYNGCEQIGRLGGPDAARLTEIVHGARQRTVDLTAVGIDMLRAALFLVERGAHHKGWWDDDDTRVAELIAGELRRRGARWLRVAR